MKSILITGVPGTGKTTICHKLKELGYAACDMDKKRNLFIMVDKTTRTPIENHDNTDKEKVKNMDWICDTVLLKSLIDAETSPLAFYCGNASNIDEVLPHFDYVILVKTTSENLKERLTTRTTNDYGKTPEIQEWITSWKDS